MNQNEYRRQWKRTLIFIAINFQTCKSFTNIQSHPFISIQKSEHPLTKTIIHTCTQQNSLSSTSENAIKVLEISSNKDIIALADLRYNEWMTTQENDSNSNSNSNSNIPSLHAFRMATAEIFEERVNDGAMAFLAYDISKKNAVAVGAAELSPIEFKGVLWNDLNTNTGKTTTSITNSTYLYVTDVVTSTSYRRMGIGMKLMKTMEVKAMQLKATHLFLHVKHDNHAALTFYQNSKLGYQRYCSSINDHTLFIDTDRLEMNSGTIGQILLYKKLSNIQTNDYQQMFDDTKNNDYISKRFEKQSKGFGNKKNKGFGKK